MIEKLSELFDTEDSMYEFMDSYFNLYETDLTIDNIEEFNWDKVAIEIKELLLMGEYEICINVLIEISKEYTKSKTKEMLIVGYLVEKPEQRSEQELIENVQDENGIGNGSGSYKLSNEDYYKYV